MILQRLTRDRNFVKKGRLAGFFVLGLTLAVLVAGCQPKQDPEQRLINAARTDAHAAQQLALMRMASNELPAALHWWRQAANLGDANALRHALMLQIRLEGKLATARWLEQHRLTLPTFDDGLLLAELGIWPPRQAGSDALMQSGLSRWHSAQGCALTLQPVVSQAEGFRTWQQLLAGWQQSAYLANLPVCFEPVIVINSTQLACSEVPAQRIVCDYQQLTDMVLAGTFQQLVLIAGRGIASYNNGIIQLPEDASLALFRHEFMHIAGFLDEYQLSPVSAKALCQPGRIAPNLLVGNDAAIVSRYAAQYAVAPSALQLTAVNTCDAVGMQAYRPIAQVTPMQHYEVDLPALYAQILSRELQYAERLMPVHYYFAYLARQQQNWSAWQQFMQSAASFGYPAAIAALNTEAQG